MAKSVNRDINSRIKAICDEVFNGNLSQMAKATYISRTTLISIVGEQQSSPGYDVLRKIVEMPTANINKTWLLTGDGDMLDKNNAAPAGPEIPDASVATIPLLDLDASAGFSLVDAVEGGSARTLTLPHCDGAMSVRGHSMEPEIHDGDIAAFVMIPSAASIRPDGVYIVQYDDEDGFNHITIKRTKRSPLGERYVRLASVNDEYGYEDVPLASISRVAKVRYTISQLSY